MTNDNIRGVRASAIRRGSSISLATSESECNDNDSQWETKRKKSLKLITAEDIANQVIRTELPPLVKPKMENQLVKTGLESKSQSPASFHHATGDQCKN